MNNRMKIHRKLCAILRCDEIGDDCRVYFQPTTNICMKYPAIVYELTDIPIWRADNRNYKFDHMYQLTLIDSNPDSKLVDAIVRLPNVNFQRFYAADNLHHWVYTIY